MLDCSSYDRVVFAALGLRSIPEEDAANFDPDILLYYWGPVVRFMADAFDIKLDDIQFFREHAMAETSFETSGGLSIKPGQIAALHYGLEGVVDGKTRLIAEYYERSAPKSLPNGRNRRDTGAIA